MNDCTSLCIHPSPLLTAHQFHSKYMQDEPTLKEISCVRIPTCTLASVTMQSQQLLNSCTWSETIGHTSPNRIQSMISVYTLWNRSKKIESQAETANRTPFTLCLERGNRAYGLLNFRSKLQEQRSPKTSVEKGPLLSKFLIRKPRAAKP